MKKVLTIMLVLLVAVASVFAKANFDKSNLSLNAKVVGYHGQYGVSYAYEKAEFGAELWTLNSPLVIPHELIAKGSDFIGALVGEGCITSLLLCDVIPSQFYGSAVYEILSTEKSELSVGGGIMVTLPVYKMLTKGTKESLEIETDDYYGNFSMFNPSSIFNICADLEYTYKIDEHNSITARVVAPLSVLMGGDDTGLDTYGFINAFLGYSGVGYRYTF